MSYAVKVGRRRRCTSGRRTSSSVVSAPISGVEATLDVIAQSVAPTT